MRQMRCPSSINNAGKKAGIGGIPLSHTFCSVQALDRADEVCQLWERQSTQSADSKANFLPARPHRYTPEITFDLGTQVLVKLRQKIIAHCVTASEPTCHLVYTLHQKVDSTFILLYFKVPISLKLNTLNITGESIMIPGATSADRQCFIIPSA